MPVKNPNSQVKKELLFTLNLLKHDLGTETLKKFLAELEVYGELAVTALKRYRLSTTSMFFDWTEVIRLVKDEIAKARSIIPPSKSWGVIQKIILSTPRKPRLHPILEQTITDIGGWEYLKKSPNQMADRSNWLKLYEGNYNLYLTEIMLRHGNNTN